MHIKPHFSFHSLIHSFIIIKVHWFIPPWSQHMTIYLNTHITIARTIMRKWADTCIGHINPLLPLLPYYGQSSSEVTFSFPIVVTHNTVTESVAISIIAPQNTGCSDRSCLLCVFGWLVNNSEPFPWLLLPWTCYEERHLTAIDIAGSSINPTTR